MSTFLSTAHKLRAKGDIEGYAIALSKVYGYASDEDEEFVRLYSHHFIPNSNVVGLRRDPSIPSLFRDNSYTQASAKSLLPNPPSPLPPLLDANYFHAERFDLPLTPKTPTEALLYLFLYGITLPLSTLDNVLTPETLALLQSSSLLIPSPISSSHVMSPYLFYPLPNNLSNDGANTLLSSDWPLESFIPQPQACMPVGQDSLELSNLSSHPPTSHPTSSNVLDMCSGSGIQGLSHILQRNTSTNTHVTFADVNPRALDHLRLNLSLNEVEASRYSIVESDGWSSLPPQKYSVILCNPPFVAAPEGIESHLYAPSGPQGMDFLSSFLSSLPSRLSPTGRCYVVTEVPNVESSHINIYKILTSTYESDVRVNVCYCFDDVETVEDYGKARALERGTNEGETVTGKYVDGINDGGKVKNRALVLISIGVDDHGSNIYEYSPGESIEYPGDAFTTDEGMVWVRDKMIYEISRSVAEVGEDNQAFMEKEREVEFDGVKEAKGLADIMSCVDISKVCEVKLGGRWEGIKRKYEERQWTGEDIKAVVDKLDAPHLRPLGMLERLQGGVDAAAFGVATLIQNL